MRTHYGPWQPCWISNQHQKHKSGRGPSRQVWLISVQRFQRRRFKCEKLTDGRTDGRTTNAYPWQKLTWPMARWAKKNTPLIYIFHQREKHMPIHTLFSSWWSILIYIQTNTHRSILKFFMKNYCTIIEIFVLGKRKLHGISEIFPLDIPNHINPHPLIYCLM